MSKCQCNSEQAPRGPLVIEPGCRLFVTTNGVTTELAPHDGTGIIVWCGVRWQGTPAPRKWWARLRGKPIAIVPGCGCIVVLRDLWRKCSSILSRR